MKIDIRNQVIIIILSDVHLIDEKIHDKEIHILKNISYGSNSIKFWVVSEPKIEANNPKLGEDFFKTANDIKIKKLLDLHVPGTLMLASWLEANGFSRDLQHRYKKSGWLESVGTGAFKRPNETVQWQGALYSVQKQANSQIHAGGLTALSLTGLSHYIRTGTEPIFLFSQLRIKLPAWFKTYFKMKSSIM